MTISTDNEGQDIKRAMQELTEDLKRLYDEREKYKSRQNKSIVLFVFLSFFAFSRCVDEVTLINLISFSFLTWMVIGIVYDTATQEAVALLILFCILLPSSLAKGLLMFMSSCAAPLVDPIYNIPS
jgi:sorbitol-specific phosphotransferase system component IIBC